MTYVDGYVLPVPRRNLDAYREMAQQAGSIWKEHGALSYKECVAEDVDSEFAGGSFPRIAGAKEDEVVIFAFVTFKSRQHRDEVNAAVFKDERLKCPGTDGGEMPFDMKRMSYGGFSALVDL